MSVTPAFKNFSINRIYPRDTYIPSLLLPVQYAQFFLGKCFFLGVERDNQSIGKRALVASEISTWVVKVQFLLQKECCVSRTCDRGESKRLFNFLT